MSKSNILSIYLISNCILNGIHILNISNITKKDQEESEDDLNL